MKMYSLSKEEAIKVYDSKWYEKNLFSDEVKVIFQLFESRLCMPLGLFIELANKVFKDEMTTIAFSSREQIEFLQNKLLGLGVNVEKIRRVVLDYCKIE